MKIKTDKIVLVEGKYDKIKLDSILDATVIAVNGFGLFKSPEKKDMIRSLAASRGAIILCDSDGGGVVIRRHLNSIIPKKDCVNLYIPEIFGKESRKARPSKEGKLGVEGIDSEILREIFRPFEVSSSENAELNSNFDPITLSDLYSDGFSGGENSSSRRAALAQSLSLPTTISTKLLVEAINILGGRSVYEHAKGNMGTEGTKGTEETKGTVAF